MPLATSRSGKGKKLAGWEAAHGADGCAKGEMKPPEPSLPNAPAVDTVLSLLKGIDGMDSLVDFLILNQPLMMQGGCLWAAYENQLSNFQAGWGHVDSSSPFFARSKSSLKWTMLKISCSESIYTTETDKCYKSGLSEKYFPENWLLNQHTTADFLKETAWFYCIIFCHYHILLFNYKWNRSIAFWGAYILCRFYFLKLSRFFYDPV